MNESSLSLFQAHPWHGVSAWGGGPGVFSAFIEIVPTDSVKYELDKSSGHLRLDRPQLFSSQCPSLYGFIPQTVCGAGISRRDRRAGADQPPDRAGLRRWNGRHATRGGGVRSWTNPRLSRAG